jgi:selenocysteine-specific elongation factor
MFVVGTAGHIDHGKTTLATFLTGIPTDRLKEEQERGISIELGFAHLTLPSGRMVGVVDVPGHERFVRHMIAGAVGVDLVMLVVAADEGVMPQTREHLDICRLLGVHAGIVVLTKVDLVEPEWLAMVQADVEQFVAGSFLESAPMLRFSAHDPAIAAEFRASLYALIEAMPQRFEGRDPTRPFRLSVDRAFTIRGFGTVVTGTVASGSIRVGDAVDLVPLGLSSRVRGIEVHGAAVDKVEAGSRAAINLLGIDKAEVPRGAVLVRATELAATSIFDGTLSVLSVVERPVVARTKCLVHVGTAQIQGTLYPLGTAEVYPGDEAYVQVRLDQPTVVQAGDAFVLRGFEVLQNHGKTLGGGVIVDPEAPKSKAGDLEAATRSKRLRHEAPAEALAALLEAVGAQGCSRQELRRRVSFGSAALDAALDATVASATAVPLDDAGAHFVHAAVFSAAASTLVDAVREFHDRLPWRAGASREELRAKMPRNADPRLFGRVLDALVAKSEVSVHGELVRLVGFEPTVAGDMARVCEELLALYSRAGTEPPLTAEALRTASAPEPLAREALDVLLRDNKLVKIKPDLLFAAPVVAGLRAKLTAFLQERGEITTPEFKELSGLSRKYSIPLGEWFDAEKVTVRVSDTVRKLRPKID